MGYYLSGKARADWGAGVWDWQPLGGGGEITDEGIVRFEAEIVDFSRIRSRIVWPESSGPWIEGGIEDLMVHFAYAGWSAYMKSKAVSLMLSSPDEDLGIAVSNMLSRTMVAMGAVQMGEIRLNKEAFEELRRDRLER